MSWWKKLFGGKPDPGSVKPPTYRELLEQVADLQERLDRERTSGMSMKHRLADRALDDRALLERYRRALEYYADMMHWRPYGLAQRIDAHVDRGAKARKALGRL